jgi:hypothetical protein
MISRLPRAFAPRVIDYLIEMAEVLLTEKNCMCWRKRRAQRESFAKFSSRLREHSPPISTSARLGSINQQDPKIDKNIFPETAALGCLLTYRDIIMWREMARDSLSCTPGLQRTW